MVKLQTNHGDIRIKLYDETPLHRDNFVKLVKQGYFDGLLFHRVIAGFMIQGGDPDSRNAPAGKQLGSGGPGYTIPAEIVFPACFHKKGALAAARQGDQTNPEKASSGSQFYIVEGRVCPAAQLDQMEMAARQNKEREEFQKIASGMYKQIAQLRAAGDSTALKALSDSVYQEAVKRADAMPAFKFTAEQRQAYTTVGGTPHLDGNYTVFGEVVEGIEVVDDIAKAKTLPGDRPEADVIIIKATVEE
jgi:cyclophilin family peptidyl-prolyl cis-trans isomerase